MGLDGLTSINMELTSRCNKSCWFCGRRKIEKDCPGLVHWADMDIALVDKISKQLSDGIVVQFHNNGEPLLYPDLYLALKCFEGKIRCFDTNGKLLLEKLQDILWNLETLTISIFEDDPENEEQYRILKRFLELKPSHVPPRIVVARLLGDVGATRYKELGCIIARRVLHSPMGSFDYQKEPTVPEIGVCQDLLHRMCINRDGTVSICVRFDPKKEGIIGNATTTPLVEIWGGEKRKQYISAHLAGERSKIAPCNKCEYWGIPRG